MEELINEIENIKKVMEPIKVLNERLVKLSASYTTSFLASNIKVGLENIQITALAEINNFVNPIKILNEFSNSISIINNNLDFSNFMSPIIEEFKGMTDINLNLTPILEGFNTKVNILNSTDLLSHIDELQKREDTSTEIPVPIKEFLTNNLETVDMVIENINNETSISRKENPNGDWKFIIGSILIPLLIAYLTIQFNLPATVENNYYNIEFNGDMSFEDIEEIIKALNQLQNEQEQSNLVDDNTEQ